MRQLSVAALLQTARAAEERAEADTVILALETRAGAAEAELASVKQHLQQGFGLIKKLKEQIAAAGPSPSQLAAQVALI